LALIVAYGSDGLADRRKYNQSCACPVWGIGEKQTRAVLITPQRVAAAVLARTRRDGEIRSVTYNMAVVRGAVL